MKSYINFIQVIAAIVFPVTWLGLLFFSEMGLSSCVRNHDEVKLHADNANAGDYFGWAVSLSGDTALVGAYRKSSSIGPQTGGAYVFVRDNELWKQQSFLIPEDSEANDYFGCSVSIDGDTAVVGAWRKNDYTGAAYVFLRDGVIWRQQAKLTASDGRNNDAFGWSVSIAGDTIVVGSWRKDDYNGAAYVFDREGVSWIEKARLTPSNTQSRSYFGYSVSVSDDMIAIGAWREEQFSGAVYVFVPTGESWTEQARLSALDKEPGDMLGYSVSIDNNTVVAGAYGKKANAGATYVFSFSVSSWEQQAKITSEKNSTTADAFGLAVSVKGDVCVIGATGENGGQGTVYFFTRKDGSWYKHNKLYASDSLGGSSFGWSVAVSENDAAVGAYADNNDTGVVHVYSIA